MKTSVIDRLGSIATGKGKLESASNTIDFLSDVSAEFSAKEAIITGVDGQTTYNYDYIRKHARKLHTELETGWEKLNKNAFFTTVVSLSGRSRVVNMDDNDYYIIQIFRL